MTKFEWDKSKEQDNIVKHGVSFSLAKQVFDDRCLAIDIDESHSLAEQRFHAYGMVQGNIMTVRFTYRGDVIRIFGAAYWRKGRKIYEKRQENKE